MLYAAPMSDSLPRAASPESVGLDAAAVERLAWADPATGISFVFFTIGCARAPLVMGSRGIALSSAAVHCVCSAEAG
jgi:hypothetical protein